MTACSQESAHGSRGSGRVARVGVDAVEVVAILNMDLHDVAAKAPEQVRKKARARAIHGVDNDSGGPGPNRVAIDPRDQVAHIGGNEVRLLKRAARRGWDEGDGLLDLLERLVRDRAAVLTANDDAAVLARALARSEDHASHGALVPRARPGNDRRGARPLRDLDDEPVGGEHTGNEPCVVRRVVTRVVANVDRRSRAGVRPHERERVRDTGNVLLGERVVETSLPAVNAKADYVSPLLQGTHYPSAAPKSEPKASRNASR